ncbi:MAG TPA: Zn-ribbon domain-containing OB-fold protein [Candidatus Limnocylindria bacterium]|nr:Zn-ribbon domain-containing OB-fold protein [Candidatus Limnocylindria bacterium]
MTETVKSVMPKIGTFVDTQPFWDAARERRLVLQYCRDTGRFQHYPRPVSVYTGSRNLEWREVSGEGTVFACTIMRVPSPGYAGPLPCAVATIELREGVRIIARIVDCEPEAVTIGMRVRLAWEELGETHYPVFRPVGAP